MLSDEPRDETFHRHARRRRAKRLLRFLPRRAVMHKYPVVGRFAEFARARAYLWSFRREQLRPAFYAGSVLSLLPVMGVQLPTALLLSVVLRGNFMVMGGLQFITNPFTAVPIYYATHQLGATIITRSGFGQSIDVVEASPMEPLVDSHEPPRLEPAQIVPPDHTPIHWSKRIGTSINALVIGGIVAGTALGAVLDLSWRLITASAPETDRKNLKKADSNSTRNQRPPL